MKNDSFETVEVMETIGKEKPDEDVSIIVMGKHGVGKSSLITAMSGDGECRSVNFIEAQDRSNTQHPDRNCSIWYCIDGSDGLALEDMVFVKNASDLTLFVVTKSELMNREQRRLLMEMLDGRIDPERIVFVSADDGTGLSRLADKAYDICLRSGITSEFFRAAWRRHFSPLQEKWRRNTSADADCCINWAAARAAAIALTPLPLADVAPLVANEAYLIYKLASLYGICADRRAFAAITGCVGGSLAGKIAAGILPVVKVPIAAGITYGVGKAAKAYFESGKNIEENELKELFHRAVREAKSINWGNMIRKVKN